MTLKVSIIINNFNYDEYIASCIESAIDQTYRNIEVIVCDDGSTDNSRAIIESYGSSVIGIFKPNGGQASAFNAGYKKSSVDLVIFLDADDILWASCVSEVVRHWHSGLMKLHFNLAIIDGSGNSVGLISRRRFPEATFAGSSAQRAQCRVCRLPEMCFPERFSIRSCRCRKWVGNGTQMRICLILQH